MPPSSSDSLILSVLILDAATQNGATPVFISSCNGQLDVVRFLSKNGADVNVAMEDGATPVYVSAATVGVPCVPLFFLEERTDKGMFDELSKGMCDGLL